ncbi:MAG: Rrf2 family transcriptional regulator [Planctomycetaceae bacterium]|nr:Rrf2 family transcriptional regulator [Planctomycetaceae bacterium]
MLFSAKAEYACVAMLELAARHADPRPVRLADVADKHGISDRFLVQILLDLKRAGLVDSTRGASGGYALARRPEEISLHDILRVIDPAERRTGKNTVASARRKDSAPPVRKKAELQLTVYVRNIRSVWDRVVEAQETVLKNTTLADLVAQSEGLQYVI